ncbi:hypothetical protein ACFO4O_04815 [Glaciecola siphonariae]|uniref:Uncharacterized protein n=1 Tax=Glaciecola siphonariae TaxID=521012 RepID=A0ABV9LU58_9ALTE
MKHLVDIHMVLCTSEDMDDFHDDPELASEKLNMALHMVYDKADEDIATGKLEELLANTWEYWHQDKYLVDIEVDDLLDWVDHLYNTWNNAE